MMDILRIKEELRNASYEEAFDIAAEKMAEGLVYAESFGIIYETEEMAKGGRACLGPIIKKAEGIRLNEVRRIMIQELDKLIRGHNSMNDEDREGAEEKGNGKD